MNVWTCPQSNYDTFFLMQKYRNSLLKKLMKPQKDSVYARIRESYQAFIEELEAICLVARELQTLMLGKSIDDDGFYRLSEERDEVLEQLLQSSQSGSTKQLQQRYNEITKAMEQPTLDAFKAWINT